MPSKSRLPSLDAIPRLLAAIHVFALSMLARLAGELVYYVVYPSSLEHRWRVLQLNAAYDCLIVVSPLLQAAAVIVGCSVFLCRDINVRRRWPVLCVALALLQAGHVIAGRCNLYWWDFNREFWLVIPPALLFATSLPTATAIAWVYLTRTILAHRSRWNAICRVLSFGAIAIFCFGQFSDVLYFSVWEMVLPHGGSGSLWYPWWLEACNGLARWWGGWGTTPMRLALAALFVFMYSFSRRLRRKAAPSKNLLGTP